MARNSNFKRSYSDDYLISTGNLVDDPKQISGKDAQTLAVVMRVASNSNHVDQHGDETQHGSFRDVKVFGRMAEIALDTLSKGSRIKYEGTLIFKPYTTRDGDEGWDQEVNAKDWALHPFSVDGAGFSGSRDDDEDESPRKRSSRKRSSDSSRSRRSRRDEDEDDIDTEFEDDEEETRKPARSSRKSSRSRSRSRNEDEMEDSDEAYDDDEFDENLEPKKPSRSRSRGERNSRSTSRSRRRDDADNELEDEDDYVTDPDLT